jgi:hypothetical protein
MKMTGALRRLSIMAQLRANSCPRILSPALRVVFCAVSVLALAAAQAPTGTGSSPPVRMAGGSTAGGRSSRAGNRPRQFGPMRLDSLSIGTMAVHDHVRFDFHDRVSNDPYPHEFMQGYAFDGADLESRIAWHWGMQPLVTTLRVTPVARHHFAFDQDIDYHPAVYMHGDAGDARSRTFGIEQQLPLARRLDFDFNFVRQWSRFHDVTTFDITPFSSNVYERTISERAVVHEIASGAIYRLPLIDGRWRVVSETRADPLGIVWLDNYVPVIHDRNSAMSFDLLERLRSSHPVGNRWQIALTGEAGWGHSYSEIHKFYREQFDVRLELVRRTGR